MKKVSTRTSQPSRFKLFHNAEDNCWYIHDTKYGDVIRVSPNQLDSTRICSNLNEGNAFEEWQIPSFIQKNI
jgi:hypothetical protein